MKKFKIVFASTAIFILLASCNKQLELPTDGRIPIDSIFNDYNQTRGYLNSCYGFAPKPYMDRASYTDEAQDADDVTPGSNYIEWYGGNVTSTNYTDYSADGSPWGDLYTGIRKCNVFLAGIQKGSVIAPDFEKAGWIAQARTLRALYYLQLIKRYGGVPILTEELPLDHDFAQDKKATFSEVVTFILEDCEAALIAPDVEKGLSWAVYDNQYGMMNRAVAYAIMSQAVTYAASPLWTDGTYTWEKATEINAEALGELLANDYSLFKDKPAASVAQNAYAYYFLISSNDKRSVDKETIYQLGDAMEVWRYAGLPTNAGMDRTGPCPTQDLIDSYEMANGESAITGYTDANHLEPIINPASGYDKDNPYEGRDPRFYASIYYNGALRYLDQPTGKQVETFVGGAEGISNSERRRTRTGYYLRKFNNFKSASGNSADGAIRLFRLAEVYLNFAESAYQSQGPDAPINVGSTTMSARDAVNKVRERAEMPPIPLGLPKDDFEKRYRNERRIELAFEEHRFFDVRRWKILDQTDKFVTGMRITKSESKLTYTRFKIKDRDCSSAKFLMYPIDQAEVNKVIGLGGENWQNPGWLD